MVAITNRDLLAIASPQLTFKAYAEPRLDLHAMVQGGLRPQTDTRKMPFSYQVSKFNP